MSGSSRTDFSDLPLFNIVEKDSFPREDTSISLVNYCGYKRTVIKEMVPYRLRDLPSRSRYNMPDNEIEEINSVRSLVEEITGIVDTVAMSRKWQLISGRTCICFLSFR